MVVLLLLACSLVAFKLVKVKMLPFDNKSEFQVIVDMPNGTTLEQTTRVAQELGQYLGQQPEVVNYQIYAGTSGPYNFNGLVRHYFLRHGANQADIQVNLLNRTRAQHAKPRDRQAPAARPGRDRQPVRRAAQGRRSAARAAGAGDAGRRSVRADYQQQIELAKKIKQIFQTTPGVVDVDWYVEDPQVKYDLKVDLDKAALHGISAADGNAHGADRAGRRDCRTAARPESREDVPIRVQLDARRPLQHRIADSDAAARLPSGGQVSICRIDRRREEDHRHRALPQEPAAGGVCAGRCGRRGREPGIRHPEDEQGASTS